MEDPASGKVIFPSLHSEGYRFVVASHSILLEHHVTKHQWECQVLRAADFATKGAAIDHDKVMECLKSALSNLVVEQVSAGPKPQTVDAIPLQGDRMQLELTIRFDSGGIVWQPSFEFVLEPLQVSESDVLRSQMRDMLERMHELEQELHRTTHELVVRQEGGARIDGAIWRLMYVKWGPPTRRIVDTFGKSVAVLVRAIVQAFFAVWLLLVGFSRLVSAPTHRERRRSARG